MTVLDIIDFTFKHRNKKSEEVKCELFYSRNCFNMRNCFCKRPQLFV